MSILSWVQLEILLVSKHSLSCFFSLLRKSCERKFFLLFVGHLNDISSDHHFLHFLWVLKLKICLHQSHFDKRLVLFKVLLHIFISDILKVEFTVIIKLGSVFLNFFKESSGITFQLSRSFPHFLDQLVIRKVLKSIVNMRTLVMDLQQLLCAVQELVMSLHEGFTVSKLLRVLHDLIENRLILCELLTASIVILFLHHILDSFSLVLIFFLLRSSSSLVDLLVERVNIGSLGSQKLRHISLKSLHFHLRFSFSHHLESIQVGVSVLI